MSDIPSTNGNINSIDNTNIDSSDGSRINDNSPFQALKKQQQQQQQRAISNSNSSNNTNGILSNNASTPPPLSKSKDSLTKPISNINTPPSSSTSSSNIINISAPPSITNTNAPAATTTLNPNPNTYHQYNSNNNAAALLHSSSKLSLLQQGPPQLSPPALFGTIEPQLYRSNSLVPINFPFIKLLNLKTVVQLSPEVPIKAVTSFLEENNINLMHLGLKAWKADASWKPITEELIKETLEIVLNYDNYPLMITCTSGIHQTGVLVGCLRRLQNWNLTSILVEYKSFTGQSNTRYVNEQFIELFDVDLVTLPTNNLLPNWFKEQQKMLEEEEEEEEEKKRKLDTI